MRRERAEQLWLSDVLTACRDTWIQYMGAHNEHGNVDYHTDVLILYSQKHRDAELETNTVASSISEVDSSFCPLVLFPHFKSSTAFKSSCNRNQSSTSVQQPLHPVFEIAEVAVAFPGVMSQFQVLQVDQRLKCCPLQTMKPVTR